jgi:hypothetical protein
MLNDTHEAIGLTKELPMSCVSSSYIQRRQCLWLTSSLSLPHSYSITKSYFIIMRNFYTHHVSLSTVFLTSKHFLLIKLLCVCVSEIKRYSCTTRARQEAIAKNPSRIRGSVLELCRVLNSRMWRC